MVEISRRRAIEDVASDLFRDRGYAATSVRDIARALDIQGASLYAHVTSKEDVLWAIVDRAAASFEAAADAAEPRASGGADPAATIAALVRAHVRVITGDIHAAAVFVHEWRALGPERRASILARRDAYQRRFRSAIAEGMSTGAFALTDADLAAITILSMLNGIPTWYDPAGRLPPDRLADQLVDLVLRMLHGDER
jgi:AcrR family transcriptional regulator